MTFLAQSLATLIGSGTFPWRVKILQVFFTSSSVHPYPLAKRVYPVFNDISRRSPRSSYALIRISSSGKWCLICPVRPSDSWYETQITGIRQVSAMRCGFIMLYQAMTHPFRRMAFTSFRFRSLTIRSISSVASIPPTVTCPKQNPSICRSLRITTPQRTDHSREEKLSDIPRTLMPCFCSCIKDRWTDPGNRIFPA